MRVLEIGQFENSVVIHFDTDDTRINAYTLASTLTALADAAKAANTALYPGSEIEIVVEALGPGSFRAQIRALYSAAKNLFSNQVIAGVVIGVLGNYIYERTLAVDDQVVVEVKTDEVIIQRGQDRVIVPRVVYDATRQVEKNPQFARSMARTFEAVASDQKVEVLCSRTRKTPKDQKIRLRKNRAVRVARVLSRRRPGSGLRVGPRQVIDPIHACLE